MPHSGSERRRPPGPTRAAGLVLLGLVVVLVAVLLTRTGQDPAAGASTAATTGVTTVGAGASGAGGAGSTSAGSTRARTTAGGTQRPDPGGTDPVSGLRWVAESALPPQAHQTLARIRAGGPYPYPRNDDQTFGNREGRLPAKSAGYYREYTVVTPGSDDRGPRRIVAGRAGELYYTDDHYASFRRILEGS